MHLRNLKSISGMCAWQVIVTKPKWWCFQRAELSLDGPRMGICKKKYSSVSVWTSYFILPVNGLYISNKWRLNNLLEQLIDSITSKTNVSLLLKFMSAGLKWGLNWFMGYLDAIQTEKRYSRCSSLLESISTFVILTQREEGAAILETTTKRQWVRLCVILEAPHQHFKQKLRLTGFLFKWVFSCLHTAYLQSSSEDPYAVVAAAVEAIFFL